jgi:preprotein translocase subunit SecG
MLYRLLIIALLIDAFVLMAAVLLQAGKGGGLAASFGGGSAGDALFGARQAGNLLTKLTWWSAGIFLGLAFLMQVFASRPAEPTSVLDQSFAPAAAPSVPPATGGAAATAPPLQALPTTPAGGDTKSPVPGTKQPEPTKKQP